MDNIDAFRDHYADLLNDYAERRHCTLQKSLKKLSISLKIKRQSNGVYEVYDNNSSFICEIEPMLLEAYKDRNFKLPDFIKTNVEELLSLSLAEVVGLPEDSPAFTAAQLLDVVDDFKQNLENEKIARSAQIANGTHQFAPDILVKRVGWRLTITCDSYLYNVDIPGRGHMPFVWEVQSDEQVKQVLKNANFTSGDIEEFKELLIVAARPAKLHALIN